MSCDWHCNRTPAEYAADAVYLRWGLQTYKKTDSRSCFQSAEPCDKGYLAKRKTRYAALLLDWRSANRKRTDLSDFSKTLGWPAKRSINFLSATVCFDFVCFTPACNVQQIFQSQVSCPVYETGICSDLNLSWIGTHWLSKIVPTWDAIPDCHSGKAHYIQYAFADWQSRWQLNRVNRYFLYVRAYGCAGMRGMGGDADSGAERETPAWRAIHGWIVRRPHTKNNDTCVSHTSQNGTPRHQHGGR